MLQSCAASISLTIVFGFVSSVAAASVGRTCPGGLPVATFEVRANPPHGGPALPLSGLNVVDRDDTLVYEPTGTTLKANKHAAIALILIAGDSGAAPAILTPMPARRHAEWRAPFRAQAIGVVFGPEGIEEKKLKAFFRDDPAAIDRLADYADQTSKVEALVGALSAYEQAAPDSGSLQSVLNGFSSQYGVNLPPLDRTRPLDQQAAALLRAITPALAPDAARPTLVQQSGSLAASVASLFFGPPAGLAIGGAALVGNLHASLFPPADFQSAYSQTYANGVALCTGSAPRHDRHARLQFVWMLRLQDADAPTGCRAEPGHVPAGWIGTVTLRCASVAQLKALPHARDWRLVSGATTIPVPATMAKSDRDAVLTLNLKQTRVTPGEYQLAALWDWTPLAVAGPVDVRPLTDLATATLPPGVEDRIVAGSGRIELQLTGADFEFVDHVAIASAARPAEGSAVPFTVVNGTSSGDPHTMTASVDTDRLAPGQYVIQLAQVNGVRREIPVRVHPPNPTLASLPLKANVGESHQTVLLRGSSLERIERLSTPGATWTLTSLGSHARAVTEREADVRLDAGAQAGDRLAVAMFVEGLHEPVDLGNALVVLGPRPKIVDAHASITDGLGVSVHQDELPAEAPVSFVLKTAGAGAHPLVQLACDRDRIMTLSVGAAQTTANATLGFIGEDTLFLSLGAGAVGRSGCTLGASVTDESTGTSDRYVLGTIVRLPRIDSFSIGDEKIGDNLYVGTLTGEGLETVEKTGWTAATGYAVQGIATPLPGQFGKQTLRIAVPWPPPAPHAPLYVWLRGEREGRLTSARY